MPAKTVAADDERGVGEDFINRARDCRGGGDSDCKDEDRRKPFCVDLGDGATCSAYKYGAPIGTNGYSINGFGTDDPVYIPRRIHDGVPAAIVYSLPLDQTPYSADGVQRIEVKDGHAYLPLVKDLVFGWTKTYDAIGLEQSGFSHIMVGPNEISLVTGKPKVGFAEKAHTLTRSGPWSTTSRDQYLAEMERRSETNTVPAFTGALRDREKQRDIASIKAFAKVALTGYIDSILDTPHIKQTRDFAAEEGGTKGVAERSAAMADMAASAAAAVSLFGSAPSLGSEAVCVHWESTENQPSPEREGSYITLDGNPSVDLKELSTEGGYWVVPLGVNIPAVSGRQYFAPLRVLTFLRGYGFVEYNEAADRLDFFITYPGFYWLENGRQNKLPTPGDEIVQINGQGLPGALWVGPADGLGAAETNYPVSFVDGRSDANMYTTFPDLVSKSLQEDIGQYDLQTYRISRNIDQACPPEQLATIQELFQTNVLNELKTISFPDSVYEGPKPARILRKMVDLFLTLIEQTSGASIDCGLTYLRSSDGSLHSIDMWEWGIFMHFVTECGFASFKVTERFWDNGIVYPELLQS